MILAAFFHLTQMSKKALSSRKNVTQEELEMEVAITWPIFKIWFCCARSAQYQKRGKIVK